MSLTRVFQHTALSIGAIVRLDATASHHVARVLRANVGDMLTLFNGQGGEYQAVIQHIDKKGVDVLVQQFLQREVISPVRMVLAQGIARGEKMDFIVQKAVELGVQQIVPLVTERCNVRLSGEREEKRLQHWQAVMVSACEQSGRNDVPVMEEPASLVDWLSAVKEDQSVKFRFVLSPHVVEKLPDVALPLHASIAVLIGPEGGLSDAEVRLAQEHGFQPLNLGPRVLRTETATIAALSVLQYCYGDFS